MEVVDGAVHKSAMDESQKHAEYRHKDKSTLMQADGAGGTVRARRNRRRRRAGGENAGWRRYALSFKGHGPVNPPHGLGICTVRLQQGTKDVVCGLDGE